MGRFRCHRRGHFALVAPKASEVFALLEFADHSESLRVLATVPLLKGISAQGSRFTDKGLLYVKDMVQLTDFTIGINAPGDGDPRSTVPPFRKPITDEGLAHLKELENLTLLDLQETQITSQGLKNLEGLKNLKDLWLSGSGVTSTSEIQKALPNCKIIN